MPALEVVEDYAKDSRPVNDIQVCHRVPIKSAKVICSSHVSSSHSLVDVMALKGREESRSSAIS